MNSEYDKAAFKLNRYYRHQNRGKKIFLFGDFHFEKKKIASIYAIKKNFVIFDNREQKLFVLNKLQPSSCTSFYYSFFAMEQKTPVLTEELIKTWKLL